MPSSMIAGQTQAPLAQEQEQATPGRRRLQDIVGNAAAGARFGATTGAMVGGLVPGMGPMAALLGGTVGAVAGALRGPQHDVPALTENADVTAAGLRTSLANNPRALRALDQLTGNAGFQALTPEQQGGLLAQFQQAPNAATTRYLQGIAGYHTAEDKEAGYQQYVNNRDPDGGTVTVGGQTYTVRNGELVGQNGQVAGNVRNDGTYQLTGQEERTNLYDDIHSRVRLTEGQDTLVDLHDADPGGRLADANMNNDFTGRVESTMRTMRRENVDMRVTDGFRSFQEQDNLYAQGRTRPGNIVTGARGGQSWHNYGTAVDSTFVNQNGQVHWPENGEYADLWRRYGEVGASNGLTWGGNWQRMPDRPHLEYHPGFGDNQAGQLSETLRNRGLEAAWDRMGIGQQP